MLRMTGVAVVIAALGAAAAAQTPPTPRSVDLKGKLYRSVFSSGAGVLTAADVSLVPEPLRARLTKYLMRRNAFKSNYKSDSDSFERMRADAKKRVLERAIVSMIDAPGIEKTAAEYISKAPIFYEWEGKHDGPLEEARYAEDVLKLDPSSPLAPWFYVFIAQRQRIVFEACENEKNEEGMKTAAKKYRAFVERARAVDDPIYAALIDDMERQPFLYIKGSKNPRDFDPDS
jgi:hypothetical protein